MKKLITIFLSIPEGTFIRKLEENDSELCNSIWEFSYGGSETFVRSLILINGGYGVFDKTSHKLLSFAIINDHFATGILTTIKEARGKKYGELVANVLTKKIAVDLDLTPTVYVNSKNVPSLNLYKKLGYQRIGDCNWVVVGDKKLW